jgi:hypothetical protein
MIIVGTDSVWPYWRLENDGGDCRQEACHSRILEIAGLLSTENCLRSTTYLDSRLSLTRVTSYEFRATPVQATSVQVQAILRMSTG